MGWAILLFAALLRLAMFPIANKSYESMSKMKKVQPKIQAIQEMYKDDKVRLQQEMMNLYKKEKINPASGCLPMLIQIPIFFALYKALLVSVSMRNAHFLWISDLSAMDPYFILPILMGATMWLQQYLQTPKTNSNNPNDIAAQTQRMMRWMPILFTIMFAWMPAGLVLYWTVSNIFGIIQMQIIKKQSK
jgi:YidC/Oxa1 family membrane protein insertase